jgi:DNA-binding NarL/FixJ family response regulator
MNSLRKNSLNIIMVDDEISFIEGLDVYFSSIETVELIETASSAAECLESIEEWPLFDVILMDIKMETPKAGIQAAQIIKSHVDNKEKIIFLTSEYDNEDIFKALQMKCSFVDKSCSPGRLIDIIQDVCFLDRQIIDIPAS